MRTAVWARAAKAATVLLDDSMVDMDKPVTVAWGLRVVWTGAVKRTVRDVWRSVEERGDRRLVFCGRVRIEFHSIDAK